MRRFEPRASPLYIPPLTFIPRGFHQHVGNLAERRENSLGNDTRQLSGGGEEVPRRKAPQSVPADREGVEEAPERFQEIIDPRPQVRVVASGEENRGV